MVKSELFAIIERCENANYHVVAVTCDQERAHETLRKSLGVDTEKTWFENPHPDRKGEKIFFFHDGVHVAKNCRNHVSDTTAVDCMQIKFIFA